MIEKWKKEWKQKVDKWQREAEELSYPEKIKLAMQAWQTTLLFAIAVILAYGLGHTIGQ